jgi:DNA-binding NtrC family response regulator
MKSANILILDFNSWVGLSVALESQLRAMSDPLILIRHEKFHGTNDIEATERLSAMVGSVKLDLVILLLASEAPSNLLNIFSALLLLKGSPPVVAIPGSDEPHMITELYRLGASDYLIPPLRAADVQPRLKRLLAHRCPQETASAALKETMGLKQFVGESRALMEQIQKIPRVARCDTCVLITGETGTGKEVCARAIHFLSPRANQPFVPLNCGAIPVDLLENELFGHCAGAFTGANASQVGVIQEANGGTLFLDEIDSLPLAAQVKLLRFLQEKEYRPLGARKVSKSDVRIIAASNQNMDGLLHTGRLRQDLFYRLNVLPLHLPPLRERKEDIPLLVRHFLAKHGAKCSPAVRDIDPAALRKLSQHDWPGNVRELENVIERGIVLCLSGILQTTDIDLPNLTTMESPPESFSRLKAGVIADFERTYLRTLLEQHRGNIAQAARTAQKNRRVFFQLMRKHHIRIEREANTCGDAGVANVVIMVGKNGRPSTRL